VADAILCRMTEGLANEPMQGSAPARKQDGHHPKPGILETIPEAESLDKKKLSGNSKLHGSSEDSVLRNPEVDWKGKAPHQSHDADQSTSDCPKFDTTCSDQLENVPQSDAVTRGLPSSPRAVSAEPLPSASSEFENPSPKRSPMDVDLIQVPSHGPGISDPEFSESELDSDDDDGLLMSIQLHRDLESLMNEFYNLFAFQFAKTDWHITECPTRQSSKSSSSTRIQGASRSSSYQLGRENVTQKRGVQDRDSFGGDEDDGNHERKRSRIHSPSSKVGGIPQKLACPYHKRDPVTYSCNELYGVKYRTCAGPGFRSVGRVKYVSLLSSYKN
jgi:hypothetical protein